MTLEQALHALGLRGGRAGQHRDEGQGPLALAQVGADRFAEPILVGDEVEGVVRDLERDTDVQTVLREGVDLPGRNPTQERADAAARRHERGGLLGDDPEVVRLGGDSRPLELELEHLGLGHRDCRARQGLHHGAIVVSHEHRERLGIQVVAHQDGCIVTPLGVRRRPAASKRRLVDDVIVNERRGME